MKIEVLIWYPLNQLCFGFCVNFFQSSNGSHWQWISNIVPFCYVNMSNVWLINYLFDSKEIREIANVVLVIKVSNTILQHWIKSVVNKHNDEVWSEFKSNKNWQIRKLIWFSTIKKTWKNDNTESVNDSIKDSTSR